MNGVLSVRPVLDYPTLSHCFAPLSLFLNETELLTVLILLPAEP